jgi:hypothetical protein
VRFRIDIQPQKPLRLRRDPIPERLGAPGDRILVDVVLDGGAGGVFELLWGREVREALRQVDAVIGAIQGNQPRHLADDRLGEALGSV